MQADDQLDEVLTNLAHQFRGTAFLRTPLSGPRSPLLAQLGLLSASGGAFLIAQSLCFAVLHNIGGLQKAPKFQKLGCKLLLLSGQEHTGKN